MNILINRLQFWQFVHILPCEVESCRAEQIVIFSVWQTLNYWWWTRMKDCTDRSDFHIRRTAFHKTLVTAIWQSQSASAPRRVLKCSIYVIQTFVGRVVLTNIWFLLNLQEYILQCIVYLITHCVTSGTDMFWHHSCRPSLCVLRFSAIAADLKVVPPQLFAYLTLFAFNVHISYRACNLSCPACLLHSRSFLCSPAPPFQCSAWLHQCHFCRPRLLSSAPCWWSLLLLRLS